MSSLSDRIVRAKHRADAKFDRTFPEGSWRKCCLSLVALIFAFWIITLDLS
jgi:hypothetical protein